MPQEGMPYSTRITGVVNLSNLTHTVSGIPCEPSITAVEGQPGIYDVAFNGDDINCPGPVLIVEKISGVDVERHRAEISGCT